MGARKQAQIAQSLQSPPQKAFFKVSSAFVRPMADVGLWIRVGDVAESVGDLEGALSAYLRAGKLACPILPLNISQSRTHLLPSSTSSSSSNLPTTTSTSTTTTTTS